MQIARSLRTLAVALAALLSACAGIQSSPGEQPQAVIGASAGSIVPVRRDLGASWMSARSASSDLLYVSDAGTFDVDVYRYPSLASAGRLTGFARPEGVCSDSNGNVWITNTLSYYIVEYAHGGTSPIATLTDPIGYPAGCAVDSSSGDLAVTNLYDFSGSGSVIVYRDAGGTPTPYGSSSISEYYFDGYDPQGDLYVDGKTSTGTYVLALLPHGKSAMALVSVKGGTIYFPGTVAWQGSSLVLGDQRCGNAAASCLYQATVSGSTARITRKIPLSVACDVAQAWVGASSVAGGDYEYCKLRKSGVDVWPYPKGGAPAVTKTGLEMPIGAALSRPQ